MHHHLFPAVQPVLALLPDYPDLGESVGFQLTGLFVVFLALASIWLALTLVGQWFKRRAPVPAKAAAAAAPAPAPAVATDEIPAEVVAVIAAAVQVSLSGSYRIQAIVPATQAQDWAHEGRRRIFASHHVR
ncbi:MAG: OadG family protein [Opitutaceae bacterium]|nr:OadG family protein [Opitutaceae bacterium]